MSEWILIVWLCAPNPDVICDPVGKPTIVTSYRTEDACNSALSAAIDRSNEILYGVCIRGEPGG